VRYVYARYLPRSARQAIMRVQGINGVSHGKEKVYGSIP